MNRLFLLLFAVIFFFSCGETDPLSETPPNDSIIPDNPDEKVLTLEEYYNSYCFGYRVKDTTGLKMITHSFLPGFNDMPLLAGLRNDRLWIAKFDLQTKEQVSEFTDTEKFQLSRTLHKGYGEYVDITVKSIRPFQFVEESDHTVINVSLSGSNYEDYSRLFLFLSQSRTEYVYDYVDAYFIPWYNSSYLTFASVMSTIIDKHGNVLFEEFRNNHAPPAEMAVNYEHYIWIGFIYPTSDTQPTLIRTWLGTDAKNRYRWAVWLPILESPDAKWEYEIIAKKGDWWTFRFDVTEFSGQKHSHIVDINVETGEDIWQEEEV